MVTIETHQLANHCNIVYSYRLPCEHKNDDADSDVKQTNDGCHGYSASSDQLNTNRNSNVLCYQPVTSGHHDNETLAS